MPKHIVVYASKIRLLVLTALLSGVALGVSVVGAVELSKPVDVDTEQRRAARSCHLPDEDGAMTVFVMEGNKIKCWRWK